MRFTPPRLALASLFLLHCSPPVQTADSATDAVASDIATIDGSDAGLDAPDAGPSAFSARATCEIGPDCTGDMNGTWTFVSGCYLAPASDTCAQLAWSAQGALTGTFTVDVSVPTYEFHIDQRSTLSATGPTSCDCARFADFVHATYPTAACLVGGDHCQCGVSISESHGSSGTSITADGGALTFDGTTYAVCVSGSTMWMWQASDTARTFTYMLTRSVASDP